MADEDKKKKTEEETKALIEQMALEARWLELQGKKTASIEKQMEAFREYANLQQGGLKRFNELSEENQKEYLQSFQNMSESTKGLITDIDDLNKKNKAIQGTFKTGKKVGDDFFGSLASKLGMASDAGNTFTGKLAKLNTIMSDTNAAEGFVTSFREIFTVTNMVGSVLQKVAEYTLALAFAVDNATAAFAAQTGAGRILTDDIMKGAAAYRDMGITAADMGKALGALYSNYPGFEDLSQSLRLEMEGLAAGMEKVGVSMDESAKLLVSMEKGLGFTKEQSTGLIREIGLSGVAMGKTFKETVKDFQSANKVLAVYGKRAPEVFNKIQTQAKAAGVEVSDLLGLAEKFDTFSSSAETAAKMNAVFGTSLSATNMLMLEEGDRVEMLRNQFQGMGRDFDDLGRFEKKAAADILGFGKDTEKTRMVLNMSAEQYGIYKDKIDKADKSQAAFKQKVQDSMGTLLKLKTALMELAITLTPLTEKMNDFAELIMESAHKIKDNWMLVTGVTVLAGVALFKVGSFAAKSFFGISALVKALKAAVVPLSAIGPAGVSGAGGIAGAGGAAKVAAPSLLKMAGAVALIGVSIAAVILSLAYFVSVIDAAQTPFQSMGLALGALVVSMAGLAIGLKIVGAAAQGAAPGLLIASVATVAIGTGLMFVMGGIAMVIESLATLIGSFQTLKGVGWGAVGVLYGMAGATAALAVSMSLMGNPFAMAGMAMFVSYLASLKLLGADLGDMAANLAAIAKVNFAKVFSDVAAGVDEVNSKIQGKVELQSTIENLALITTGQSSKEISNKGGGAIDNVAKALEGLKGAMKNEVNITLKKEDLEDLFAKGFWKQQANN